MGGRGAIDRAETEHELDLLNSSCKHVQPFLWSSRSRQVQDLRRVLAVETPPPSLPRPCGRSLSVGRSFVRFRVSASWIDTTTVGFAVAKMQGRDRRERACGRSTTHRSSAGVLRDFVDGRKTDRATSCTETSPKVGHRWATQRRPRRSQSAVRGAERVTACLRNRLTHNTVRPRHRGRITGHTRVCHASSSWVTSIELR